MSYLSDTQIKILIISKDSPHISNIVEQKDFKGNCKDQFIKNNSVFDHFSGFFSTFSFNPDEIASFEKTREIIKSELGIDGVDVLLSHEKKSYKSMKDDYEMNQLYSEWLTESDYPEGDVLESNTPDEYKGDWDYYY